MGRECIEGAGKQSKAFQSDGFEDILWTLQFGFVHRQLSFTEPHDTISTELRDDVFSSQ